MAMDQSCKEPNQTTLGATTMAKKRSFKRTKRAKPIVNNNMAGSNFIELLPSDMIAEVISKVASSSVTDFFNCKLSCKMLDQIGKEKYVIRRVGIEEFNTSRLRSRHNYAAFFAYSQLCADCGNPGALFRQGMRQYFSHVKLQEGSESLDRAASLGHKTSAYVLGLILLCCGSVDEKHTGMKLINGLKACMGKGIVDCRIRTRESLRHMWLNNELVRECKPISFPKEGRQGHDLCRRRNPWVADAYLLEDEDDALFCEACTCVFESKFFCWLF